MPSANNSSPSSKSSLFKHIFRSRKKNRLAASASTPTVNTPQPEDENVPEQQGGSLPSTPPPGSGRTSPLEILSTSNLQGQGQDSTTAPGDLSLLPIPSASNIQTEGIAADNVHQPTSQQPEGSSAVQGQDLTTIPGNLSPSPTPGPLTSNIHEVGPIAATASSEAVIPAPDPVHTLPQAPEASNTVQGPIEPHPGAESPEITSEHAKTPASPALSQAKKAAKSAWHGFKVVSKNVEQFLDGTPFKVPLSVINTVIGMADTVIDHKESLATALIPIGERLKIMGSNIESQAHHPGIGPTCERFKTALERAELTSLGLCGNKGRVDPKVATGPLQRLLPHDPRFLPRLTIFIGAHYQ